MFVHAPSKMRPAKYDNELAQIAADFEEACDSDETVDGFIGADGAQSNDVSGLLMNTNIRKPIMDAVKSLSGALAKKQAA
jgi:hypothetical protein